MPSRPIRKPKSEPPARKSRPLAPAARKSRTSRPAAPARIPRRSLFAAISRERWIDILGVVMALVGLLVLLSLVSRNQSALLEKIVVALRTLAGWGTFVLPLVLIIVGVWLVLRRIEKLPIISGPRLTGMILLYLNIMAAIHLLAGGGAKLAEAGDGGGQIGNLLLTALTENIGTAGAVVILIAWLLVALIMTFDISLADLVRFFKPSFNRLQQWWKNRSADRRAARAAKVLPVDEEGEGPIQLPPDFRPLQPRPSANQNPSRTTETSQPAKSSTALPAGSSPAVATRSGAGTSPGTTASPGPTWTLPSIDAILDPATPVSLQANLDQDRARTIEETLASFGAPAHVVDISRGPTVTQFGVEPDFIDNRGGQKTRVRVAKIAALVDDLALALAAHHIRIQAPVPGRNYVGIEVPNAEISRVTLREVMESDSFKKLKSPLRFAIGKDVSGRPVSYDLTAMPHLLIAGTTGSGKSVCVNSILCCLLLNNTPNDIRLVLVDPKRVELTGYNGVPHLLAPVVTDAERVIGALQWMMREMDSRYRKFSESGVRNIAEYNARGGEHLPYLVVVVDELADLMMMAPEETERSITRLAQLARATGIHLILATQRPSVDVVTGLIKANFPARIAFAVASGIDSRVILDQPGAERLLGRGDMLFQAPDASAPVRLQGAYVGDSEIQRLVDYWRLAVANLRAVAGTNPVRSGAPVDALPTTSALKQTPLWDEVDLEGGDPLLADAVAIVRKEGKASTTMLQKKLRIGYTRAARLVDTMEQKKIIGPPVGTSQVREVLDFGQQGPPVKAE